TCPQTETVPSEQPQLIECLSAVQRNFEDMNAALTQGTATPSIASVGICRKTTISLASRMVRAVLASVIPCDPHLSTDGLALFIQPVPEIFSLAFIDAIVAILTLPNDDPVIISGALQR